MLKAKVVYNENEDSYEIWVNTGDGWGFANGYKCVARKGGNDETNFVSFQILAKLREMQAWGYKIRFE